MNISRPFRFPGMPFSGPACLFLAALFLVLTTAGAALALPLSLENVRGNKPVLPYLAWMPANGMGIAEVAAPDMQQNFQPLQWNGSKGFPLAQQGPVWVKLVLMKPLNLSALSTKSYLFNLGPEATGKSVIYYPRMEDGRSVRDEWASESLYPDTPVPLPEPGLVPMTLYIHMEQTPGLWFAPSLSVKGETAEPFLPPTLLLPGILAGALLVCLLRAAKERTQWPLWSALFLACILAAVTFPLLAADIPQFLAGIPLPGSLTWEAFLKALSFLAPGIALMVLPHLGRHMLQTKGQAPVQDIILTVYPLVGAALCIAPLLPGLGWLAKLFPLWPLLLIPLLPVGIGALAGKRPAALPFTGACALPVLGACIALYGMGGQDIHPLTPTASWWGLTLGGIGLALARVPKIQAEKADDQAGERFPLDLPDDALLFKDENITFIKLASDESDDVSLALRKEGDAVPERFAMESSGLDLPPLTPDRQPEQEPEPALDATGHAGSVSSDEDAFAPQEQKEAPPTYADPGAEALAQKTALTDSFADPAAEALAKKAALPPAFTDPALEAGYAPPTHKNFSEIEAFLTRAETRPAPAPRIEEQPAAPELPAEAVIPPAPSFLAEEPLPEPAGPALSDEAPETAVVAEPEKVFPEEPPKPVFADPAPATETAEQDLISLNVITLTEDSPYTNYTQYTADALEELSGPGPRQSTPSGENAYVFSLTSLVKEVHDVVRPLAKSKNLVFSWFIAPSLPSLLEGDASRLRQALSLLLQNSVHVTGPGGTVQLTIRKNPSAADPCELLFTVVDSGASKRTDAGFFHAWDLAARTGGAFSVEYSPSGGTLVSFTAIFREPSDEALQRHFERLESLPPRPEGKARLYLPETFAIPEEADPIAASEIPADILPTTPYQAPFPLSEGTSPRGQDSLDPVENHVTSVMHGSHGLPEEIYSTGPLRIIVAEMTTSHRRLLASYLGHIPHTHLEARNIGEILAQCRQKPAALIIFDGDMPEMDIVRVIHEIRALERKDDLPPAGFLAITGHDAQAERMRAAGCGGTLAKPFSRADLEKAVQALVPDLAPAQDLTAPSVKERPRRAGEVDLEKLWAEHAHSVPLGETTAPLNASLHEIDPVRIWKDAPPREDTLGEPRETPATATPPAPVMKESWEEPAPEAKATLWVEPEPAEALSIEDDESETHALSHMDAFAEPEAEPEAETPAPTVYEPAFADPALAAMHQSQSIMEAEPEAYLPAPPVSEAPIVLDESPTFVLTEHDLARAHIETEPETPAQSAPAPSVPQAPQPEPAPASPSTEKESGAGSLLDFIITEETDAQQSVSGHPKLKRPTVSVQVKAQSQAATVTGQATVEAQKEPAQPAPAPVEAAPSEPAPAEEIQAEAAPEPAEPGESLEGVYLPSKEIFPLPGLEECVEAAIIPLVPGLIHSLRDALKDARQGCQDGSTILVQEAVGRLAGKAEMFGLGTLNRLARCVERAAEADDMEAVQTLLVDLENVTARYMDSLNQCYQDFLSIAR